MDDLKKVTKEIIQESKNGNDLSIFLPIAEKWLETQTRESQIHHDYLKEELKERSNITKQTLRIITFILLGIFLISAGIIFYLGNLESGLLVLSHVGAVIAGLIAGMGIEKSRNINE
ncbi:hypothetical protein [Leptospira kanakyensis]|uniref:hypothetical protein n=1 Tax=Leptospira kanakyensis TaxID=2484968 RepID=UPI00223E5557|nr:hypothetical protein [Leptospira kanakyensis]MCW7471726.1 hypothetical protein [Leptospira kanakyensis]